MIITQKQNKIIQSQEFNSVNCTIDAEDMRYVASLLRNNYSNTRLAVVREVSANALDANTEAGSDKKIEISVPTTMHPNFSVRDFGGGLSKEDVFGLYSKYGKSTKRKSNNYIGAFGIGKFAPLSYGDSFTCISYNGGVKTSYNIFVNDNDDTEIVELYNEPSNEPTGLKIEVAVADSDIREFTDVVKTFFRFFNDTDMPKFLGVGEDFLEPIEYALSNDDNTWFFLENKNQRHYYRTQSHILMGRVAYPIAKESIVTENFISDKDLRDMVDNLLSDNNFYFRVPLGAVKLHHSRESLEYSKSTQKELCRILCGIAKNVKDIAISKLADSSCLYMAKSNHAKIVNSLPYGISNIMRNVFEWKSFSIQNSQWSRPHELQDDLIITRMEKQSDSDARNGFRVNSNKSSRVVAEPNCVFVMQDLDSAHGNNLRARTLFNDNDTLEVVYFIHGRNSEATNYINDEWGFKLVDEKYLFNSSEVDKEKIVRNSVVGSKSRSTIPVFKMSFARHPYRNADYWEDVKNPINSLEMGSVNSTYKGKMVYASIKNYKIEGYYNLEMAHKTMQLINKRILADNSDGISIDLFGVRTKDVEKLDSSNWISFEDMYVDYAKDNLKKNLTESLVAFKKVLYSRSVIDLGLGYDWDSIFASKDSDFSNLGQDHCFAKLASDWNDQNRSSSDFLLRCVNVLVVAGQSKWMEKTFKFKLDADSIKQNVDLVKERYPLIKMIAHSINSWQSLRNDSRFGDVKAQIDDYISLCDRSKRGEKE